MSDKPLTTMTRKELGEIYHSFDADYIKELVTIVALRNRYLSMTVEELRTEWKNETVAIKKQLIEQIGKWRKERQK